MPVIKIEHILSYTSEDPTHIAENILSNDSSKKWKCKTPGEKTATVVLQLDKPYLISGIDIGNEYSAYIEVLVSRSGSSDDFKMLLVMSSFMTPLEARQAQNGNKVRMFKQEDFIDPERKEKWDRIKIVCTQPFNRHIQYGLSFIKLYSNEQSSSGQHLPSIGNFVIRPESPVSISCGSLFARKKEIGKTNFGETLSSAAAIRKATVLAQNESETLDTKLKHNLPSTPDTKIKNTLESSKPRNRNELFYDEEDEKVKEKFDKLYKKKTDDKIKTDEKKENKQKKVISDKQSNKNTNSDDQHENTPSHKINKRKTLDESGYHSSAKKKKQIHKPFNRLLEDVVLVISGIQNPERANLRSISLSMGAKYKADWDNTCTHLICAFANTPKFKQVKGKGKIVTKKWLKDCSDMRKKLPWRRYAFDKADKDQNESEEEILEEPKEVEQVKVDNYDSDPDILTKEDYSDTEEKVKELEKKKMEECKQKNEENEEKFKQEDSDTDHEQVDNLKHKNLEIKHQLADFFENKKFFVDKVFDANSGKKLKQYIVAYKGVVSDEIQDDTDIVVTNESNYKKILQKVESSVVFVGPDWIWECHNQQKMVPSNDFVLY